MLLQKIFIHVTRFSIAIWKGDFIAEPSGEARNAFIKIQGPGEFPPRAARTFQTRGENPGFRRSAPMVGRPFFPGNM